MKNILWITIVVLLFSTVSCAKKSEPKDEPIKAVASSKATDTIDYEKENVDVEHSKETLSNNAEKNSDKETTDTINKEFSDVFKDTTGSNSSAGIYGYSEVCSGFGKISINGIDYERRFDEPKQFPASSEKYSNIDFDNLKLSGETATLKYYIQNQIDGFSPNEYTSTVQLYELPDELSKDPYIDVIAVKLTDGDSKLFYCYKSFDTLGDFFDMLSTHFGHDCSNAEDVKELYINFSSDELEEKQKITITDPQSILSLFECIREFTPANGESAAVDSDFVASGILCFQNDVKFSFHSVGQGKINLNGYVSTADFATQLINIINSVENS